MQEAEIGRTVVLGQPRQKSLQDSISMEKSWAWWHMSATPATAGSIKWEDHDQGWPRQNMRPYLQNNQSKKD
jgi:hypothetical protein